jgi:hypothetical protein
MPARTSSGKIQVNLSFAEDSYKLLQQHSTNRKGYGVFIEQLLKEHVARQQDDELRERVERLERRLAPGVSGEM